ncbi:MAG: hypothetical protein WA655_22535 [Candidatus Korobacteraceae bacterium]
MPDSTLDQIVSSLQTSSSTYFPGRPEVKSARVVGHTPKPDHYIYEIVLDFPQGSERVNAKIYRSKSGPAASQELATREARNLAYAYQTAEKRKLGGIPRPLGNFEELGAVVSTKVNGLQLQSMIMKTALLADAGNHVLLEMAARRAGEWLQNFHRATAGMPVPVEGEALLADMERLCVRAEEDGLPPESTEIILNRARSVVGKARKTVRSAAVLQEFVPLNVLVAEDGIGVCEFANMTQQGQPLRDAAIFLAAVEALEKYPFCHRSITTVVQDSFIAGYGVGTQEQPLLDTLKMKVLLQMFAQGRTVKESAERKRVMWANVMKRFIQRAAERSTARAA